MEGETSANLLKDMNKAFQYAIKACDLGSIYACVNVSIMYKRGDGVEQNADQSEKYKKKAVAMKEELDQRRQLLFQEGLKPV
jgi:cytochrome c oxidase assembly factor 7